MTTLIIIICLIIQALALWLVKDKNRLDTSFYKLAISLALWALSFVGFSYVYGTFAAIFIALATAGLLAMIIPLLKPQVR